MNGVVQSAPAFDATRPVSADASSPLWALYGGGVLMALALPALKIPVGLDLRLGQLLMAVVFALLVLRDLHERQVRWDALLAVAGGGAGLCALSVLTGGPQVKELTFLIKYLVVFPTAFYLGLRLPTLAGARRTALIVEITLLAGCLLAVLLNFHPVPALIHERPAHLSVGLKGSFWEQGELAFFAGLFLLTSLGLRVEHGMRPRSLLPLSAVYGLALGCALASMNKTVWVALIGALMIGALLFRRGSGVTAARRWTTYLALFGIVCAIGLWLYNAWLPEADKLVTGRMLEHKWENERGAALRIAWELIMQAPLLGHGFGFVEAYFGSYPTDVIGLGGGVAQLFNSYLDIWLSVGVPGLIFALGLLLAALNRRSPVSLLIVSYLFVFANVNPLAQHEYYYLFLGIALAAARGEIAHPSTVREAPWATR